MKTSTTESIQEGRVVSAESPDRELWSQLANGDIDALGPLFDRHAQAVYNLAFRHLASWSAAEEVVQSTFVAVWQRGDRRGLPVLDRDSALPWILGVALNECRNASRSRRRALARHHLELADQGWDTSDELGDQVADRVDEERRMAAVRAAMARIPSHERETIELVVWSGLSTADAARALGVAEGTVKSRLHRGRARLATALATLDPTPAQEER